jgi:flagellar biosynthesis/type III secretory pathway M-ring protein FliF/YscJ
MEQTMMKRIRRRRERRTIKVKWQWLLALCFVVLPAMTPIFIEAQTEQQSAQGTAPTGSELSPQEKKVIEYLQSVWAKENSVMSVDQAMAAGGSRQSDETRFRIGQYIKQHPELHVTIRRWGWETLVLTPEEKLIARAIINVRANRSRHRR